MSTEEEFPIPATDLQSIYVADIVERLNKLNIEDLRKLPAQLYNHKTEKWETITGFSLDNTNLKFYAVSEDWMKRFRESRKAENTLLENY